MQALVPMPLSLPSNAGCYIFSRGKETPSGINKCHTTYIHERIKLEHARQSWEELSQEWQGTHKIFGSPRTKTSFEQQHLKFKTSNSTNPTVVEVNWFYHSEDQREIYMLSSVCKFKKQTFPSQARASNKTTMAEGRPSISLYLNLWLCNVFSQLKDKRLAFTLKHRAKSHILFLKNSLELSEI